MLPARAKKIDISVRLDFDDYRALNIARTNNYLWQMMTEEEKKLFRLYGKLPTHKNVLTKMQKVP